MLEDTRFVRGSTNAQLGAQAGAAPAIVARPAARIAGRVVYENGKPASGVLVEVFIPMLGSDGAVTKSDGSYLLQSLAAGPANVSVIDRSGKWVTSGVQGLATVEGKTVKAPDIVLSPGAIIEGTVTDEATGKPRAKIGIYITGPQGSWMSAGGARATSDKNGHFSARVAPGKNRIQLFNPDGYGRTEPEIPVEIKKGEKKQVAIKLEKEIVVTGRVTDAIGKPIAGERVNLMIVVDEHNRSTGARATTDERGAFQIPNMVAGKARITVGPEMETGKWQIAKNAEFDVPAKGPVDVVVKKADVKTLTGRVVTPAGKPVPGATVTVWVMAAKPETWGKTPRLSANAEGIFQVDGFTPGMKIDFKSATKIGYAYLSGGVFKDKDGAASISDIVLAPLSGKLSGRVTDSTGAPVANARVATIEGGAENPTSTGPDGSFALNSIPEGDVTVIAATGSAYGSLKAQTGGGAVEVKLQRSEVMDAQRVYAALQELWDEASKRPRQNWWRTRIPVLVVRSNPDLALKMLYKPDGSVDEEAALETIVALMRREPGRALDWGLPLLDSMKNPRMILRTACVLGLVAAGSNQELARSLYARAKEHLGQGKKESDARWEASETMADYAHLASLAGKLADGEGDAMLDKMIETMKQAKLPDDVLAGQTGTVAMGSVLLAEKLLGHITGPSIHQVMDEIAIEASFFDIPTARRMLRQIEDAGGNETNHGSYGQAAMYVILALGPTDLAGALEVARSVHNDRYRKLALGIAAPFQPREAQIGVLREAFDAVQSDYNYVVEDMSWIGWLAHSVDPKASLDMFATAKNKLQTDPEQQSSDITAYAMYYSAVDPASSRLMLESDFVKFKQAGQSRGQWALEDVADAMSVVDVGRAVELAKQIRDLTTRGYALAKIARYALASDDGKQKLMRLLWTRSEAWYYGGPSPW